MGEVASRCCASVSWGLLEAGQIREPLRRSLVAPKAAESRLTGGSPFVLRSVNCSGIRWRPFVMPIGVCLICSTYLEQQCILPRGRCQLKADR